MAHAFFLGLDVADDGSVRAALIGKEKTQSDAPAEYHLHRVRRLSGDPDDVASDLQGLVADPPYTGRTTLGVNCSTDTGQALFDALEDCGLTPTAVSLVAGSGTTAAGDNDEIGVRLASQDAVTSLATLYRTDRLHIEDQTSEDASALTRQLQLYSEILAEVSGTERPDSEDGDVHLPSDFDAVVMSAALAAWLGTERTFDPTEHLHEPHTTVRPQT